MSSPSIGSAGSGAPTRRAIVGSTSIVIAGSDGAGPRESAPASARRTARARRPRRRCPSFAQRPGRAGVIAVREPGPVVGGEDHERVALEPEAPERGQQLADRVVDLLDHVAVEPLPRSAAEARRTRRSARAASCAGGTGRTGARGSSSMKSTARSVYSLVSCDWSGLSVSDGVAVDRAAAAGSAALSGWFGHMSFE